MGKARRFYGNPFCFLAHMTGRLSPERGRISNQNNKSSAGTPVCCAGTRNWRLPQSLRAHTQPLDCQAADSTAAILWRKKTRGGSTDCRVSFETGANKSGIQCVYASFSNLCTPRRKRREEGNSGICPALFQLRFALFFFTARSSAPCSTNMARRHRVRSNWNAHWITHISYAQKPTPVKSAVVLNAITVAGFVPTGSLHKPGSDKPHMRAWV